MFVLAIGLTAAILQATTADSCAPLIPDAVRQAASQHYPRYELPRESDNTADDIRAFRRSVGGTCLGAAVGRFTGKPTNDYALLLTEPKSGQTVLVVATQTTRGWQLDLVHDYGTTGRSRLYVQRLPPGHYVGLQQDADSKPPELTSALPGVGTGVLEVSAQVFFFRRNRWIVAGLSN